MSKKSACKSKLRYDSEEQAEAAAVRAANFHMYDFDFYNCPVCKGWHTMKKKQSSEDELYGNQ